MVFDSFQHWHKVDITGRLSPCARFSHAACSIGFQREHPLILVKGGCIRLIDQLKNVLMEVLNDMWVLDVDKAIWSKVSARFDLNSVRQQLGVIDV